MCQIACTVRCQILAMTGAKCRQHAQTAHERREMKVFPPNQRSRAPTSQAARKAAFARDGIRRFIRFPAFSQKSSGELNGGLTQEIRPSFSLFKTRRAIENGDRRRALYRAPWSPARARPLKMSNMELSSPMNGQTKIPVTVDVCMRSTSTAHPQEVREAIESWVEEVGSVRYAAEPLPLPTAAQDAFLHAHVESAVISDLGGCPRR